MMWGFSKSHHLRNFLFIALFAHLFPSGNSAVAGQYEQFCTSDTDCSKVHGLTCQNQRCKCAPGGETVFSLSKNRCVGAAGRECLRNGNGTLCVENAVCRDYNYMFLCVCSEGHYQSRDGKCYKIAQFGESCREEDFSCGDPQTTSISCLDGKCSCVLGDNQFYDPLEARCISYAGSQCLIYYSNPCSVNSYCGEIAENINGASFVVGHRCLCKAGFSYTRNRKCLARFGTHCNAQNPCNYDDSLGCVNGICQCRDALNQQLEEKSGQCRLFVGSQCTPNSGPKCVQNAECSVENKNENGGSSNNSSAIHKCSCMKNYSQTPLGTCLLDINQKCEPATCNHYNSLICVFNDFNTTCQCVDSSLKYDKNTKMCYAKIGSPCGSFQVYDKSSTNSNESLDVLVHCEQNAICSKNPAYSGISSNSAAMRRICKGSGLASKS